MANSTGPKFYAVRHGREGPKIYNTWEETKDNISRYSGARHKSFRSLALAQAWLLEAGVTYEQLIAPPEPKPPKPVSKVEPPTNVTQTTAVGVQNCAPPLSKPTPAATNTPVRAVSISPEQLDGSSTAAPAIALSPEQRQVLNKVKEGQSVFFTGSAGTGKSVLLREIISWCRSEGRSLGVTASTGIASVNIGGMTLHSWAGIGLGKESAEHLAGKILGQDMQMRKKQADAFDGRSESEVLKRWRKTQTLIIDEISMIDGTLFDKLEFMARKLRRDTRPFGGIQLVLSGDFCQLPPVPEKQVNGNAKIEPTFAFDAESWDRCVGQPICLKKVFRQKQQEFIDMLNAMRLGNITDEIVHTFRGLSRRVQYTDGLEPTDLFPLKRDVERENNRRLALIQGASHRFISLDSAGWDAEGNPISQDKAKKLLKDLIAPEEITLKVGAQVMLIKNLVQGSLVNGSLGKVIGFCTTREAKNLGVRIGIPEAQRSNGKPTTGPPNGDRTNPGVQDSATLRNHIWPRVRFNSGSAGEDPVEVLCVPSQFEVNNADGRVEAIREQVPLILAWALSIHKSQGQTLERVRVDQMKAYVALSRATSMDTLEVRNFNPIKVQAHRRVLDWMRQSTDTSVPYDEVDEMLQFWED